MEEDYNETVFLTHYDLDAGGAYIMAKHAFDLKAFKCQGYPKVDKNIDWLIERYGNKDNRIVVADLCCSETQIITLLESFGKVVYFDHHQESKKIVELAEIYDHLEVIYHDNLCSTALVYRYWVEKLGGKPTSALSHFAQVVEVYDNWRTEHELWYEAYGMNELFWKQSFFGFVKTFEDGMVMLSPEQDEYVQERLDFKKEMIENSPKQEAEHGSCIILFESADALNDVVLEMPPNNYFMVYKNKPDSPFSLSIRSSLGDESINIGEAVEHVRNQFPFVEKAGGHEFAAGTSFNHGTKISEVVEYINAVENRMNEFYNWNLAN